MPTPTVRGTANYEGTGITDHTVDVTSTCSGDLQQLAVFGDAAGSLPAVTNISGGGVSGFEQIAINTHGGPRMAILFNLEGSFTGADITVTFAGNVNSFDAALIDWADAKAAVIHVEKTGSLTNATNLECRHHHVSHADNAVAVAVLTGSAPNAISLKSDETTDGAVELFSGERGTGQISTFVGYSIGGFTGDAAGVEWSGGTFSNMFIIWEVEDPASDSQSSALADPLTEGAGTSNPQATATLAGLVEGDVVDISFATFRSGKPAGVDEKTDGGTTQQNGGGIGVAAGVKEAAGTYGETTATLASNFAKGWHTIALKPEDPDLPPFVASAGSGVGGAAAITVAPGSDHASGDIDLLYLETANQDISLATANGFVEAPDSPQGTGTAGAADTTRLTVFWRRWNGSDGSPVTTDSGNHQYGVMVSVRGCVSSGDPWDVTSGGVDATADTSLNATGDETTVPNCLVLIGVADGIDSTSARWSAWANADLVYIQDPTSVVHDAAGTPVALSKIGAKNIDSERTLHRYAFRVGASPPTAAITITFSNAQGNLVWQVHRWRAGTIAGTGNLDWSDDVETASAAAATTVTPASLGTLDTKAAVSAAYGKDTTTENWSPEAGYVGHQTPTDDGIGAAANLNVFTAWTGSDFDNTPTGTTGASADLAVIAVEVIGVQAEAPPAVTLPHVTMARSVS